MPWFRITKITLLGLGLLLTLLLGGWLSFIHTTSEETEIVFLSIGEGDSILIREGTNEILIDGGREGSRLLSRLGTHLPFYDRTIETVIPTHPDADHIGGLPELFKRYRVETVLTTGSKGDTETEKLLDQSLEKNFHGAILPAVAGTSIELPHGVRLDILFPRTPLLEKIPETNRGSVVARFTYGETSFLLTGDLPDEEEYLPDIEPTTVLKAAHHGSHYSTSDTWLDLVKPKEAIISVGKNNYGHPSPEVLERLKNHHVPFFRTDELGDIVYQCREAWHGCERVENQFSF